MQTRLVLDDVRKVLELDKDNMLKIMEDFPQQCEEAVKIARDVDLGPLSFMRPQDISSVVFLGMGASGITGDIIQAALGPDMQVPIFVNKGYELPMFVDNTSLVFAISYSGETEETLTTFEECLKRGIQPVVISTGGTLLNRAKELGLANIVVPSGYQPRAAVGFLVFPALAVIEKLHLVESKRLEIEATLDMLKAQATSIAGDVPTAENPAKQLAEKLYGRVPVIYGAEGLTAVAAMRFKEEINENAKVPAFYNSFPELNHNEIVGWELLKNVSESFALVVIRETDEYIRIKKRIDITLSLIKENFGEVAEMRGNGESKLARVLSLIHLGDTTSVYLALLNGIDPSPVNKIKALKEGLKET